MNKFNHFLLLESDSDSDNMDEPPSKIHRPPSASDAPKKGGNYNMFAAKMMVCKSCVIFSSSWKILHICDIFFYLAN